MRLPEKVGYLLTRLRGAGFEAYAVGGCVRDALLGREPHDWDVCTSARPEETHAVFADRDVRDTGLRHGTVTVVLDGEAFEITTFRVDGPYADHRRPDNVRFTRRLAEDLARRDLTINAMAYSPETGLVDPFGGQADLEAGLIRCVGAPEARFGEDALRILRALRFASRFDFEIEPATSAAMRKLAPTLSEIAAERVRVELEGVLLGPGVMRALRAFSDVAGVVVPEILPCIGFDQLNPYHPYDVWEHTLHSIAAIPPEPLLRWTMLLHDLGKPACFSAEGQGTRGHFFGHGRVSALLADEILTRLRFSKQEQALIRELVEHHDRFMAPTRAAVRRQLGRIGPEQFERSLLVREADIAAQNPAYAPERLAEIADLRRLAAEILREGECLGLRDLAVDGRDLIALGYAPGPALGEELRRLLALVLEDPAQNGRDTLLTAAARDLRGGDE